VFLKHFEKATSTDGGNTVKNDNASESSGGSNVTSKKVVIGSTKDTITNITNNTFNIYFVDVETATIQFSRGVKNEVVEKDETSGFYLSIHRKTRNPEFLAVGFYASCSFGDKKDLPIWVGFQYWKPSVDGNPEKLTFSIELLKQQTWENAGIWKGTTMELCGYENDNTDDAFCKFFDGITLKTDGEEVFDCFCGELKKIGERLGN
jgi:hypothetical protein